MPDLKQRRNCYRGDDCRNIFDRRALKIGAIPQVPVPSSGSGILAIGSLAPAFLQVPVPSSSSGGMLAIGSLTPGRFYRCLSPLAAVVC
jgi:hypothetical protein